DVHERPRRPGDPPALIAVADRIRQVLGWTPSYDDLDAIVATAIAWERRLARLYELKSANERQLTQM
ncbi:MAG: hypothetical protein AB7U81_07880, partial [Thiohalomonadaceae bacterium]